MKTTAVILLTIVCAGAGAACPVPPMNTPSEDAKKLAVNKLNQLLACDPNDPINDQSPCNIFASRGLEAIYGVTDFKANNKYLSANQIADFVEQPGGKWKLIGGVFDVDNNLCAQAAANAALPVIAVKRAAGHGHIALVIPGEPAQANSWGMLSANSASFLLDRPSKSYVSKTLNYAFEPDDAKKAKFYYRSPR